MTGPWARMRAVTALEWRVQRREPLTVLYVLVFGLLAMAFAAAGPVELVRGRGAVPRDAAWSLMLASTAITAFGQVITTMVAATVVLRDRADRVADLLVTTRLTVMEYRSAKLLAALGVLVLVYAAVPVGLVLGALLGGGDVWAAVRGSVPPFVVVVVPTMLAIGALQFAVGVLSGRLWVIVGQGLVLIWLWTAAIDSASRGADVWPSLLDPFGSAPLLAATRGWSDVERAMQPMPVTAQLIAGRAVWLLAGGVLALVAIRSRPRARIAAHDREPAQVPIVPAAGSRLVRAAVPRWWMGSLSTARYVARWMLRDTGWRVLAVLGALNVGLHAAGDLSPASDAVALLTVLQTHARLFLILLATIYAGELVWREREERSAALFGALPVQRAARTSGRLLGVLAAQVVLVGALAVAAVFGAVVAGASPGAGFGVLVVTSVLVPFHAWLLLSLLVHVVVQQKVVAHLLCIAGWALATVRFGAASAAVDARVGPWGWGAMWLLAVSIVLVAWREEGAGRRWDRRSRAVRALG